MSEPEELPKRKCDKCKQRVLETDSRVYHLSLRANNTNNKSLLAAASKVVLCSDCDSARSTNLVKYLNENE